LNRLFAVPDFTFDDYCFFVELIFYKRNRRNNYRDFIIVRCEVWATT